MSVDDLVDVPVVELRGFSLRYALAVALGLSYTIFEPEYGVGRRILIAGSDDFYRPDVIWSSTGPTVIEHLPGCVKWVSENYGTNWLEVVEASGDSHQVWLCRAVLGSLIGDNISIPSRFIEE